MPAKPTPPQSMPCWRRRDRARPGRAAGGQRLQGWLGQPLLPLLLPLLALLPLVADAASQRSYADGALRPLAPGSAPAQVPPLLPPPPGQSHRADGALLPRPQVKAEAARPEPTTVAATAPVVSAAPAPVQQVAALSRRQLAQAAPNKAGAPPMGVPSSPVPAAPVVPVNCLDAGEPAGALPPPPVGADAAASPQPRNLLQTMVKDALARSHGLGAARLLAEAAQQDVAEARASKQPQAYVNASVGPSLVTGTDGNGQHLQARASLTLSQTLYDGGRSDRTIDWRRQQAESARLGLLSTQEQVSLTTTSLAFERSRFRMQAVIYSQNVRRMACLLQSLESIVSADKGRSSELVQARKQLLQAELQQTQAQSQARQVGARLRRIVGDGLPATEGLSGLLISVPELSEVLSAAERSSDIAQLSANAAAMREVARVVEAGNKPLLSWNVGGDATLAVGGGNPHTSGLSAGLTLTIPLLNPAIEYSTQAARKRAEAAQLQRSEALEQRRQRIVEVHEQAVAAVDRLSRLSVMLRDSDRLRDATLQQWQQLGRRSLFDVIATENDHYNLRVQYANALHDGQQMNATLWSLGQGLNALLQ